MIVVSGCLMVLAGAGCHLPPRSFEPLVDASTLDDGRFIHYLATVPAVTVDEGARAVLLLANDGGPWPTPGERLAELTRRRAVRQSWDLRPDDTLTMGAFAHMLRRTVDLPRSVSEVVLAPAGIGERRYALYTCIHAGLLPPARSTDPVRGGEVVAALVRAENLKLRLGENGPLNNP